MSRLQKKPPAHKRGHPTLQNMNFFYFCGSFFALLDPDPYSNYGSGSNGPIEYGSNTDPDTDPDLKPWQQQDYQHSRGGN
jgi:hypothetical protein